MSLRELLGGAAANRPKPKPKNKPSKPKPKPKAKANPNRLSSPLRGGKVPTDKGSTPGKKGGKFLGPRPSLAPNLSARELARESGRQGAAATRQVGAAQRPLFNQLAAQQRGQINALGQRLDNRYTADARAAVAGSLGDAGQMGALGATLANQAQQGFATSGPTEIEQELYRQGQAELALGRSLSPEQLREATQSARGAFAARGLGTSMGSAAAELLNRDRYATEREAQRRQFAATANNLREENVLSRRDSAGRMGALSGDLMANAARTRQLGATLMTEIDPYARAINPGLSLGQTASQLGLGATENQFGDLRQLVANTGSFNVNRMDNLRTNWMDNRAAIRGANKAAAGANSAASASRQAGIMGMVGGIGGGVAAGAGLAIAGIAI